MCLHRFEERKYISEVCTLIRYEGKWEKREEFAFAILRKKGKLRH